MNQRMMHRWIYAIKFECLILCIFSCSFPLKENQDFLIFFGLVYSVCYAASRFHWPEGKHDQVDESPARLSCTSPLS
jgi:hypothetical protein